MAIQRTRYLTKSRYKLALECPTKLFYTAKPKEYADSSLDDPFLRALARGGFQVGELAKCYFPGGIEVKSLAHDDAVAETDALLAREDVIIFEAAIRIGTLFVRVDVLEKKGKSVRLIEVKSKSFDPTGEVPFFDKRSYNAKIKKIKIKQDYAPYLYDVAYQTHVMKRAKPDLTVSSFLMLPDKSKATSIDGLNQLFVLRNTPDGRSYAEPKPGITTTQLGERILCEVNVDEAVDAILTDKDIGRPAEDRLNGLSFEDEVQHLAKMYAEDKKIASAPGGKCRDCQFRAVAASGQKSGFDECWKSVAKVSDAQLHEPFVFDLWKFQKVEPLIEEGRFFIKDMAREDVNPTAGDEPGLSQSERQWLQVEWLQTGKKHAHVDVASLTAAMSAWKFPLHFIDFETTMVAIPFNAGCRPYQQIAFQFSNHVAHTDGRVEHVDQYLNMECGKFPNFDFVRARKKSLITDAGTIFRYASHENTVLCQIYDQLRTSGEIDKNELMVWIKSITKSTYGSSEVWQGERCMVDMWELTKRFYYHPAMGGSVSIKKVLPALLSDSPALQTRFSEPVYGSKNLGGVRSLKYSNWSWIKWADGKMVDPYQLLPKVYRDLRPEQLDQVMCDDELADGGAAMTAYSMMQFSEMGDAERKSLGEALLKYCELDTFAMVLLYEYWREFVSGARASIAA